VTWPILFLLVVLKIPVVYLCAVVWWAIRAEPRHEEPAALVPVADLDLPSRDWHYPSHARRKPPRGPVRRPSRSGFARVPVRR